MLICGPVFRCEDRFLKTGPVTLRRSGITTTSLSCWSLAMISACCLACLAVREPGSREAFLLRGGGCSLFEPGRNSGNIAERFGRLLGVLADCLKCDRSEELFSNFSEQGRADADKRLDWRKRNSVRDVAGARQQGLSANPQSDSHCPRRDNAD